MSQILDGGLPNCPPEPEPCVGIVYKGIEYECRMDWPTPVYRRSDAEGSGWNVAKGSFRDEILQALEEHQHAAAGPAVAAA